MELHYIKQGAGFPILCLHGHPGSAKTMGVFVEGLSDRYWTLAPDLRGYGRSRTRSPFALEDSLPDLIELLDGEGIERCLVLGWSLGGILALELALRYPQRVVGLVLIATAARPVGNHPPPTWLELINTGLGSILNLLAPGNPLVTQGLGPRSLYRYLLRQHTPLAYQHLAKEGFWAYLGTSPLAHRALNRALARRYNRLPDLNTIAVPCLVLCGAEDRHITAQASLETAAHLPQCHSHCYPNTAHLLPWEIPHQMLADIHHWLANHGQVLGLSNSDAIP
ncbi:alpha/beta hydrolase [Nodosilinea sp. LEGE 07088]|uniref:alpha/beta fold hydrolase n=1 Tax=Nodosilinea sp. LEGE 07088 TaxID=2777968 RepID=UPI001881AA36|nr:alpha/beta hydrolase [Nodosilinea sp. LEGE 07088]MBE9136247.1 alpha/beta hydrolase [Nodosilinea sp. LEGE 07088]